nr:MAG TPA: hypothetical protein [Caudoviricetes sp.]
MVNSTFISASTAKAVCLYSTLMEKFDQRLNSTNC